MAATGEESLEWVMSKEAEAGGTPLTAMLQAASPVPELAVSAAQPDLSETAQREAEDRAEEVGNEVETEQKEKEERDAEKQTEGLVAEESAVETHAPAESELALEKAEAGAVVERSDDAMTAGTAPCEEPPEATGGKTDGEAHEDRAPSTPMPCTAPPATAPQPEAPALLQSLSETEQLKGKGRKEDSTWDVEEKKESPTGEASAAEEGAPGEEGRLPTAETCVAAVPAAGECEAPLGSEVAASAEDVPSPSDPTCGSTADSSCDVASSSSTTSLWPFLQPNSPTQSSKLAANRPPPLFTWDQLTLVRKLHENKGVVVVGVAILNSADISQSAEPPARVQEVGKEPSPATGDGASGEVGPRSWSMPTFNSLLRSSSDQPKPSPATEQSSRRPQLRVCVKHLSASVTTLHQKWMAQNPGDRGWPWKAALDPEARKVVEDFAKETHSLLALPPHRNVIRLIGIGRPLTPFLVMELMEMDLATLLTRKHLCSPMSPPEALKFAIDLASGVRHLHAAGWVHRDLKPANLGVTAGGVLKIMDFGLARPLPGGPVRKYTDKYCMTGKTGSMRYMAPEVLDSQPYNLAVDIYSTGVILVELLEPGSEKPFSELSMDNFKQQVVNCGYRPVIKHLPQNIIPIVDLCWHADANQRPDAPTLVDLLCHALVRFLDWKWKVRPTDLLFDWVGDYLYKEYMGTLKDFEDLCSRCPERVVIEATAKRFINCVGKLRAKKDSRWEEVDRRLKAFAGTHRLQLTLRDPDQPEEVERDRIYITLDELNEQHIPGTWPPPVDDGASQCSIL
eukprot:GGOE01018060.1.p1 GENE.GGOE01018060.1~~GGOE01018060.1.p1  ORF type:complete len:815 (-),score=200.41 GGOE01018060.1:166-2547(-)